ALAEAGPLLIALLGGGLLAALAGYLGGLPSLRLRGAYLAIVTLGSGEIIRVLILNIDAVGGRRGWPGSSGWANFFGVGAVVLAAILLTLLPEVLRPVKDYRMVMYALMLITLMITRPQGLMGSRELSLATFRRRRAAAA